jgi:hypothetical protein
VSASYIVHMLIDLPDDSGDTLSWYPQGQRMRMAHAH